MKPVTYLKRDDSTGLYYECDKEYGFPVYTHPVKELTDEDFMQIMRNRWDIEDYKPEFIFQLKEFARAILRKAKGNE